MKISDSLSLSPHDLLIGVLTAAGSAVVAILAPSIQAYMTDPLHQNFELLFNWTVIWHTAVAGAIGYLQVKFFSPAPKVVKIDPSKTAVIDKTNNEAIIKVNN